MLIICCDISINNEIVAHYSLDDELYSKVGKWYGINPDKNYQYVFGGFGGPDKDKGLIVGCLDHTEYLLVSNEIPTDLIDKFINSVINNYENLHVEMDTFNKNPDHLFVAEEYQKESKRITDECLKLCNR